MILIAVVGISYAVFSFASIGEKVNSVTTGAITMTYTEGTNSIRMENALPMSDENGKNLMGGNQVFDFTVSVNITGDFTVAYEVVAEKQSTSTLGNQEVKLYLEKSTDQSNYESAMEPTYYIPLDEGTAFGAPVGSMIMDTGVVNSSVVYYYKLRMWVDEEYQDTGTPKSFTVKVNVYGTTEKNAVDHEGPICEFNEVEKQEVKREAVVQLRCVDTKSGVEKRELTIDDLINSNGDIGQIKKISSPKRITNGYLYEITILGEKAGNLTLTLPRGKIKDRVGNKNEEVTKEITINGQKSYKVTYDYKTNGGTNASKKTEEVNIGEEVDLDVVAEKEGWVFVGWNIDQEETEKLDYLVMPEENVVLYAIYKKEAVTLTARFDGNGAQIDAYERICKLEEVYNNAIQKTSCTVETPTITRTGYTIIGYHRNINAKEKEVGSKEQLTLTSSNTGNIWYAITSLGMSKVDIEIEVEDFIYDGTEKRPTIIVKDGDIILTEGEDYTVSYENNTNAGEASVVITGTGKYNDETKNSYTGSITKPFTIKKKKPLVIINKTGEVIKTGEVLTFTEESDVKGNFSHISSDPSVVKVSPSSYSDVEANTEKAVTITGFSNGTSTITITFTPINSNYSIVEETYVVIGYQVAIEGSCANLTYNGKSQNLVSGGEGVSYSNNKRIDAGDQIVTVAANDGFQFEDGTTQRTMSCGIEKKSVEVNWEEQTTFSYNGEAQAPTVSATSGVSGESIVLERTTGTNVGAYLSTASIKGVVGGQGLRDNYTLTNTTKQFTIIKKDPVVTLSSTSGTVGSGENVTFTETANVAGSFSNISDQPTVAIVEPERYDRVAAGSSNTVTITGKSNGRSVITVVFTPSDSNYNAITKTYIVSSFKIATMGSCANLTYNGKSQTLVKGGEGVTYSDHTRINAGSQVVTVIANNGYQFEDGTTQKTISCGVKKKSVPVNWGAFETFTYDGDPHAPIASAISGIDSETINIERTTEINAGSYTSTASIKSVEGGQASTDNYSLTDVTKEFVINKATPSVTLSETSSTVSSGETRTFTEKANIAGSFTNTSEKINVATVSPAGYKDVAANTAKTVTITGVADGSSIITIVFTPTDQNYNSVTKTYTVASFKVATTGSCKNLVYNGKSQTLASEGEGVSYSNNTRIDAGSQMVNITANGGYQFADGTTTKTMSCGIEKKSVAVSWGAANTFTYDGDSHAPIASATSGVSGETIVLTRTEKKNAGNYTSTASIASVEGGRARHDNYTLTNATKSFTINKATPTVTLSATSGNVNQDETIVFTEMANIAGNFTNTSEEASIATVSPLGYSDVVANTAKTVNITGVSNGTSTITVTFVPVNTNYNTVTKTYTVTSYKVASEPSCNSLTYNGKSQVLVTGREGVRFSSNSGVNAGNYNVEVFAASGYRFSDHTTNKTLSCSIAKKSIAVDWDEQTTFSYNGSSQAPIASAVSGISGETINIARTTGTNAGNYTSTASISSVEGGQASKDNYTLTNTTKQFTINKITPTVTLSAASGSVNKGETITFTETANIAGNFTNKSEKTSIATVSPASYSGVAANTVKTVTITGVSNGTSSITVTFTPTNANYNTVSKTYTVTGYKMATMGSCADLTYNGLSQTLASGGEGVSYSNNTLINAGSKTVTITAQNGYRFSDYTTSKTLNCSIKKKSIAVNWEDQITFTYNGNIQVPTASATSGISGESIVLERTTGTNVGAHLSTASIKSVVGGQGLKDNYTLTNTTKQFTIIKKDPVVTLSKESGTVNSGENVTFTETTNVAGSFSNISDQPSVATVDPERYNNVAAGSSNTVTITGKSNGRSVITVVFTPSDSNYNAITKTYTVTGYKVATVGGCANLTYNGADQTLVSGGEGISYSNNTGVNAGSYNITMNVQSGYRFSDHTTSKTLSCSIVKKSVAVSWGATTTFTYNGSSQAPTVSATSGVSGEVINLTRTTETNAGSYTSTASISSITGGQASKDNYTLTNTTKQFTINKATPTVTLSATSGSVNKGETTTFTEKANIVGNFTNTSSTSSVATVSPASYSSVAANTAKTVTITGVSNGTSNVTVTFTPTSSNYNTVTKTYAVTGYKVATTGSCASRTYNGSSQTLAGGGEGISYSNNTRVNAGSQSVTVTAQSGYRFSDHTTSKTLNCSIEKATPTLTLSGTKSYIGKKVLIITAEVDMPGRISFNALTPDIATVSPDFSAPIESSFEGQIHPLKTGSNKVRVMFQPDDENYGLAEKIYNATVKMEGPIWEFESATTSKGTTQAVTSDFVTIKLNGLDYAYNYMSSSLTADDIKVLVGGEEVDPVTKTLSGPTSIVGGYQWNLTLSGIANTGDLSLVVAKDMLTDVAGNHSIETSITTGIKMVEARAYTYNQTANASNYCVTGYEATCKESTCYKKYAAGSCPSGTIINHKVNDSETVRFHVMFDEGSTMTMQTQRSIASSPWMSKEDYIAAGGSLEKWEHVVSMGNPAGNTKFGPLTILKPLEDKTNSWANVNNQTYELGTTIFKDNSYTGCNVDSLLCIENQYTLQSRTAKARMITFQELKEFGCTGERKSCPVWVYNYMSRSEEFDGTVNDSNGGDFYWTVTSANAINIAHTIAASGKFAGRGTAESNYLRPVVVISKDKL